MTKLLTEKDFQEASSLSGLPIPLIKAVAEVESKGDGFLDDGRPKILFEGHIFYSQLKKIAIDPEIYVNDNDYKGIIYPKWTKKHYKGGEEEYNRLAIAKTIDFDAALKSASWGRFQIMGFNHKSCGFDNVRNFVHAMEYTPKTTIMSNSNKH